jgi:hypothetical protein
MKNPTIDQLKKVGFKVIERHYRNWELDPTRMPVTKVFIASFQYAEEAAAHADSARALRLGRPLWRMSATGGRTEITLEYAGITSVGVVTCSDSDNYVKNLGRNKALGLAIQDFKRQTSVRLSHVNIQALVNTGEPLMLPTSETVGTICCDVTPVENECNMSLSTAP